MLSKQETYKNYTFWYKEIENYREALEDLERTWVVHHRLELQFSDGTPRPVNAQLTSEELIALGTYFDRPPEELIFLTKEEHKRLHSLGHKYGVKKGAKFPGRKNSGQFKKGQKSWNFGVKMDDTFKEKCRNRTLGKKQTEETKQKRSEAVKAWWVKRKEELKNEETC
jgi:hypothetical protein